MGQPCPRCGCAAPSGAGDHALQAALQVDDLDAAMTAGLLDAQPCMGCDAGCNAALLEARDTRRDALAARARYRARGTRLARIRAERETARQATATTAIQSTATALPSAAADALARALAKARERRR